MEQKHSLTEGAIYGSLVKFALPVLLTLFLQSLYGAVDLLVVGQFAETADVSGVSTGSMLTTVVSNLVTGLSMGITVLVGEKIGQKNRRAAGEAIGSGICLFIVLAVVLTIFMVFGAVPLATIMQAPEEAFAQTVAYLRICGSGMLFIVAFNVLGAVFRGIGDSNTPLITVSIACVVNIFGDLLLVDGFHMGAAGAAIATVAAQAVSVILSLIMISRRKNLPFEFSRSFLRFDGRIIAKELRIGIPVALQDLLVSISFLVIMAVVNTFGVAASAAIGVGEKVCAFIMLVPSSFMQSMSAFVAQNMGAGKPERAKKALLYAIITGVIVGAAMCWLSFTHGDLLASIFSTDAEVVAMAHRYLRAYAIDCLLTCFMFCFVGYFNGMEKTIFVMLQGIVGAFCVRIPVVLLMSHLVGGDLFYIGLATPCSTAVQIVLCLSMYVWMNKKEKKKAAAD